MRAIYRGLCPNCGGDITDEELVERGVCRSCLPIPVGSPQELLGILKKRNRLQGYGAVASFKADVSEFMELFRRLVGSPPWSLQEIWARRVLLGHSFSIVAPTGMGKTVFGLVMSLFLATRGWRCYIIVPSSLLAQHLLAKITEYAEKMRLGGDFIVGYYSGLPKKESEETLKRIERGEFRVLITTDNFLYKKFELLKGITFNFVFVDDVDSFLRSPKNIDKAVMLMGYEAGVLDKVLRAITLRSRRRPAKEELDELENIERMIPGFVERPGNRILVVSGATIRGKRTRRMQIFRYLFGFEPGFSPDLLRNIVNFHMKLTGTLEESIIEVVKRHGRGCLLFVPSTMGVEGAVRVAEVLGKAGVAAYAYRRMSPKMIERFIEGQYQVLVGVASNRSPLARGLDLPEHIRYVVFAGVPRREMRISKDEYNPNKLLTLFRNLAPILEERFSHEASRVLSMLSKVVPVRGDVIESVRNALESGEELDGFHGYVLNAVKEARRLLDRIFTDEEAQRLISRLDVYIRVDGDGFALIIPDVDGFIQASGRASRLYAGGLSRGISITLIDDEKAFHGLRKRLEVVYELEQLEEYREEEAVREFRRVDADRELIARIRRGEVSPMELDILRTALVIVESPTKAYSIASFFGRPARRRVGELMVYESTSGEVMLNVAACQGHVFDLTTSEGHHGVSEANGLFIPIYTDVRRCRLCGHQFTDLDKCPNCGSREIYSKRAVIEALRRLALESNRVLIATDPDAEGEKIGYDIYCSLHPYNENIERLEFHEVTRRALREALANPLSMKMSLVDAQIVRRIEDRWVGFELSKKLWEKFGNRTLSAGRVQTPVLGWVIQRLQESKKRRMVLSVSLENGLRFELVEPPDHEALAEGFERGELKARVEIESIGEETMHPSPPYTTDTLLRDAANHLRLGTGYTMRLAQTLFESGLITYHRTDSTSVSTTGIGIARQYIEENFPGLFRPRPYRGEGAHECIRPTKPLSRKQIEFYLSSGVMRLPARVSRDELRLYDLIFTRFMASQMVEARIRVQRIRIRLGESEARMRRVIGVLEPGFLRIHPIVKPQEAVREGDYRVTELVSRRVPMAWLFSEGDLISLMKERGIGRPSTYSRIIEVLYGRRYIFLNGGKIIASRRGQLVYDYLSKNFSSLVSEDLTRRLEALMDEVEKGEKNHQEVLSMLHRDVELITQRAV